MSSATIATPLSRKLYWVGWALSILATLLLLMGATMAISRNQQAVEGLGKYGYPESVLVPVGLTELVCTVLFLVPQTSVLGAILLTGYLGGATATHVRVSEPFYFPIIFGAVVWLALILREPRLRALLPLTRS